MRSLSCHCLEWSRSLHSLRSSSFSETLFVIVMQFILTIVAGAFLSFQSGRLSQNSFRVAEANSEPSKRSLNHNIAHRPTLTFIFIARFFFAFFLFTMLFLFIFISLQWSANSWASWWATMLWAEKSMKRRRRGRHIVYSIWLCFALCELICCRQFCAFLFCCCCCLPTATWCIKHLQ